MAKTQIDVILMALVALPIALGIVCLLLGYVYTITKGKVFKRFYHDVLGWHIPNDSMGFNGCSATSSCKICKHSIMLDSQGNWF